jgi:voltage-gated sodium channel
MRQPSRTPAPGATDRVSQPTRAGSDHRAIGGPRFARMLAHMTRACRRIVDSSWFDPLMLVVIFVNAVTLGLETYDSIERAIGDELHLVNDLILGAFVIELLIRFGAEGFSPRRFFRSGWNAFDFVVIAASFAPGLRQNATLLRLVRLARIVRAVRLLPDLRVLTVAVGRSIPGVASLAVITLLLVYVYGMVGWVIFQDHDPANFENVGQSMVTMFVLLTLENLPTYIEKGQELSNWTLLFYVSYVLVASFLIFNLFIGIVINSMEEARAIELHRAEREVLDDDHADDARAHRVILRERLHHLRNAVEDLEREIEAQDHSGLRR